MQRQLHTVNAPIHAKLHIPGSKNLSLRALLLATLAEGVSELTNLRIVKDTQTMINALRELGIVTQLDESFSTCIVAGGNGHFPKKQATVWCEESQIVERFLIAASSVSSGVYYFDGAQTLRDRSITDLLNIIRRQGCQIIPADANKMPFTLVGADTLEGGEIIFNGEANSQIISALLMIAPFARSSFIFKLPRDMNLAPIDMTIAIMAEFGVLVHHVHQGQMMIPVPQRYSAKDFTIEPDFGLANYFFAAAAITNGELTIQPVRYTQSKQSSVKFLSALEKMGCHVLETHQGLTVKGTHDLQGLEVSMPDFSDTFLALTVIAPFAKSPTRISHLGKLNKKEIERLNAIKIELINMGVRVESGEDWIKIFPGIPQGGIIVNTHHDPHLAMAFAVLGLKTPNVTLDDDRELMSYCPEFFKLWEKLGEQIDIKA